VVEDVPLLVFENEKKFVVEDNSRVVLAFHHASTPGTAINALLMRTHYSRFEKHFQPRPRCSLLQPVIISMSDMQPLTNVLLPCATFTRRILKMTAPDFRRTFRTSR